MKVMMVIIIILWNCSISENQSLVVMRPWWNLWLIAAVIVSMCLHFVILEIKFLAVSLPLLFSFTKLGISARFSNLHD